jgi:hypothetical protein
MRWIEETSDKATHKEDLAKLRWLDQFVGHLSLEQITLDVIDSIRAAKLKEASKSTTNRYLALIRSILITRTGAVPASRVTKPSTGMRNVCLGYWTQAE